MTPAGETGLVVLAAGRASDALVERALSWAAATGGRLAAAFVIDAAVPERVAAQLADSGFLGERPSGEFLRALLREYEETARDTLTRFETAARARGLLPTTTVRVGDFAETCLSLIDEYGAARAFVGRQDRSALSRFLFGSAADEVARRAPCPVDVVAEETA